MSKSNQTEKNEKLSFFKKRKYLKINAKAYKRTYKIEKTFNKLYEGLYSYTLGKDNKEKIKKLETKLKKQVDKLINSKNNKKIFKTQTRYKDKIDYNFYPTFVERVINELEKLDNIENKHELMKNIIELKKELLLKQTEFFKLIQKYV